MKGQASKGSSIYLSIVIFTAVLSTYISFVDSNISGGDAGELASCLCRKAIPHPPGYPTFAIVYQIATSLLRYIDPLQTPAFYYSLITSLVASAAAVVLALTAYTLTGSFPASIFSSLIFSFSSTVFTYSTQVEVFALNNLLMTLFIWSIITNRFSFAAFISGLAMSNQHTSLLFILPFGALALLRFQKIHLAECLKIFGLFLCGLLPPYSLLYFRSSRYRSWGETDNIFGIIKHILRHEYGTFRLANENMDNASTIWNRIGLYSVDLVDEISILVLIVSVLGIWSHRHSRTVKDLALTWTFYVIAFASLNNMDASDPLLRGVQQRFYQQPSIIMSLLLSFGYKHIQDILGSVWTASCAVIILAIHIERSVPTNPNSIVQRYAKQALQTIPNDALVFVSGDLLVHPMLYLQSCEQHRHDLDIIPVPNLATTWFVPQQAHYFRNVTFPGSFLHSHPPGFTAVQLIEANIGERRIFSCGGGLLAAGEDPAIFRSSFHVQTFGICSEITSKLNATWNQLKLAFDCLMNFKQEKFPLTSWDNAVLKHVQLRKIGLFHAIYDFVFHNFQRNEVNFNYLLVAVKLFDTIEESLKNNQVYRRASDIFGWLSRIQPDPYESYMFKTLKKIAETGKDDAIESFIKNRENPYLMQRTM